MELRGIRGRREAAAVVGFAATACTLAGAPGLRYRCIRATTPLRQPTRGLGVRPAMAKEQNRTLCPVTNREVISHPFISSLSDLETAQGAGATRGRLVMKSNPVSASRRYYYAARNAETSLPLRVPFPRSP